MTIMVSQIANRYAEALIAIDIDKSILKEDLLKILDTITDEVYSTFDNPSIPDSIKIEILDNIFKDKINDKILEFLKLLIEKKRINKLKEIYNAFIQKYNEKMNMQEVTVISAVELDNSYKSDIKSKLETKLVKQIHANWVISEDIIGGLVIKLNDTVIDTSLKNKFEKLTKHI